MSTWLNGGADPAEVAARAGQSVAVLLKIYAKCVDGQRNAIDRKIQHVLDRRTDYDYHAWYPKRPPGLGTEKRGPPEIPPPRLRGSRRCCAPASSGPRNVPRLFRGQRNSC